MTVSAAAASTQLTRSRRPARQTRPTLKQVIASPHVLPTSLLSFDRLHVSLALNCIANHERASLSSLTLERARVVIETSHCVATMASCNADLISALTCAAFIKKHSKNFNCQLLKPVQDQCCGFIISSRLVF